MPDDTPQIKMTAGDFNVYESILAHRLKTWSGRPDIHGYANKTSAHQVGLWGEIGVLRWMRNCDVKVDWTGENDDSAPDFFVQGAGGIETKAQQPRNWTTELGTTVQQRSFNNWKIKGTVRFVVWTVTRIPSRLRLETVYVKGWNTLDEIESAGLYVVRGQQQYRTYPKFNHPHELIAVLGTGT